MQIVVVVSRNLMDLEKIRQASRFIKHDLITCSTHSKIVSMMSAGGGDRKFKLIFDHSLYSDEGLQAAISQIESTALKFKLIDPEFLVFIPHEQLNDRKAIQPNLEFVARSKFFHDVAKYLN